MSKGNSAVIAIHRPILFLALRLVRSANKAKAKVEKAKVKAEKAGCDANKVKAAKPKRTGCKGSSSMKSSSSLKESRLLSKLSWALSFVDKTIENTISCEPCVSFVVNSTSLQYIV